MKKIEILGTGCSKCDKLATLTKAAAEEAGIEYELTKVADIQQIMKFGVVITPALVIDGEVKATGKIPSVDEIKEMLR